MELVASDIDSQPASTSAASSVSAAGASFLFIGASGSRRVRQRKLPKVRLFNGYAAALAPPRRFHCNPPMPSTADDLVTPGSATASPPAPVTVIDLPPAAKPTANP